jgi:hypothetical protein
VSEHDDVRRLLGPLPAPEPPPDLGPRLLAAAAPLLAAHARRARWRTWLRPLLAALVPLPAIVAADAFLVRAVHTVLSSVLPAALTTYLVGQYALLLVLLLALAYAAVPLVAERQGRAALEASHV